MDVGETEVVMITDVELRADIKHMAKTLQASVDNITLLTEVSAKLQTLIAVHEEKLTQTDVKLISGSAAFQEVRSTIRELELESRKADRETNKRIDKHEGYLNKALGILVAIDVGLVILIKFWS